jgi:N-carbamoylputrescine amidase
MSAMMRVALIQLSWAGQRSSMRDAYRPLVAEAAQRGAQVICLPEFSLSPYFAGRRDPSGFDWAEPLRGGESDRFFSGLAQEYGVALIASLFERDTDDRCYDTATVHGPDGNLIGFTRKVHIPSGDGYHETDYFGGGSDYPVHDVLGLRVAVPTCYDQWFPELARICALRGAEFIYYPTAIGSEPNDADMDSMPMWQTVMRGHAIANGLFIGAANRTGTENNVTFYGSSFLCDPMGNILAQAGRDTTEVIVADLDAAVMARWRGLFPLLHQRKPHLYGGILTAYQAPDRPDWLPD